MTQMSMPCFRFIFLYLLATDKDFAFDKLNGKFGVLLHLPAASPLTRTRKRPK